LTKRNATVYYLTSINQLKDITMSYGTPIHILYAVEAWTALQPVGRALLPAEASAEIRAMVTSDAAKKGLGRSVIADLLVKHAGWQRSGRMLFLPPGARNTSPAPKPIQEMVI
jgi:hypothetical protein